MIRRYTWKIIMGVLIGIGIIYFVNICHNQYKQWQQAEQLRQAQEQLELEKRQAELKRNEEIRERRKIEDDIVGEKVQVYQLDRPHLQEYLEILQHPKYGVTADYHWVDYERETNSVTVNDRINYYPGAVDDIEQQMINEYWLVKNTKLSDAIGSPEHVTIKAHVTDGNYNIHFTIAEYRDGKFIKNVFKQHAKMRDGVLWYDSRYDIPD